MAIVFRPAQRAERPAIAGLMRRLNREDPGEYPHDGAHAEGFFRLYDGDPERAALYVAAADGECIGYALLIPYLSHEFGGRMMYLDEFYVLPAYRNKGTGGEFLAFLERECGNRGFVRMALEVMAGNEGAARFYGRHGYERQGRSVYGKAINLHRGAETMSEEKIRTEEFQVNGEALVAKIKELVHAGNIRRITIKDDGGRTLIEIPLTLGVIGAVLLPVWAAIGALAALAANYRIVVEKVEG